MNVLLSSNPLAVSNARAPLLAKIATSLPSALHGEYTTNVSIRKEALKKKYVTNAQLCK
jgi:hypothetical protein